MWNYFQFPSCFCPPCRACKKILLSRTHLLSSTNDRSRLVLGILYLDCYLNCPRNPLQALRHPRLSVWIFYIILLLAFYILVFLGFLFILIIQCFDKAFWNFLRRRIPRRVGMISQVVTNSFLRLPEGRMSEIPFWGISWNSIPLI